MDESVVEAGVPNHDLSVMTAREVTAIDDETAIVIAATEEKEMDAIEKNGIRLIGITNGITNVAETVIIDDETSMRIGIVTEGTTMTDTTMTDTTMTDTAMSVIAVVEGEAGSTDDRLIDIRTVLVSDRRTVGMQMKGVGK